MNTSNETLRIEVKNLLSITTMNHIRDISSKETKQYCRTLEIQCTEIDRQYDEYMLLEWLHLLSGVYQAIK